MKLLAIVILPLAALSLTGCASVTQFLSSESETHFADGGELFDSGIIDPGEATWLPTDASDIALQRSTKSDVTPTAVIAFTSGSELIGCVETERLSLPAYNVAWGPGDEIVAETTVHACGEWVFVPVDNGWFGWTPSAPGERDAT